MATADYGGPITAMVGPRQHRRHAVPPREEPDARPRADRQFPAVASVILFPAIDLKDGECVRLVHGDMAQATVFNADPAAQAATLRGAGLRLSARRRSRRRLRGQADERARRSRRSSAASRMPVQLGGGIRDMRTVDGWLDKGVARVIIGTAAVRDPDFVREAARLLSRPDRGRHRRARRPRRGRGLGADRPSVSARRARPPLRGRRRRGDHLHRHRPRRRPEGPQHRGDRWRWPRPLAIPVIASGGLASIDDVERLLQPDCARLAGAITGRALYDGRLDAGRGAGADPRRRTSAHAQDPHHPLPRREGRPRRQGRQFRRPARRRRSRSKAPSPTTRPAPTNSASSTSPPATRTAASCSTSCAARPRPASCR